METSIDVAGAWQQLGQRLRAFVARRVEPAEVDDIVQSVMVKLLERRGDIGESSVAAWLFTVTRNAVAEHYRRRRPSVDLDAFGDVAEKEGDPAERTLGALSDCLEPMLRMLGEADAEVLRKVDLQGVPQVALAEALGLPLSTLKSRVQRARAKLRAAFDGCCAIDRARDGSPVAFEPGAACAPRPCTDDDRGC